MKKILGILVGLVLLVAVGIIALVTLVDPNQFKDLISEKVKETTNQELLIKGDISWNFYPTVGLSIGQTELKNPAGFAEANLIKFDEASLNISVMPLLSSQLDIGELQLSGARFFIQTLKNGSSNLDGLTSSRATETKDEAHTEETSTNDNSGSADWTVTLAGISLKNASALIIDDQAKTRQELSSFDLSLDKLELDSPSKLTFAIKAIASGITVDTSGEGEILISKGLDKFAMNNLTIDTALAGDSIPNGKMDTKLVTDMSYTVSTSTADLSKLEFSTGDTVINGTASYVGSKVAKVRFKVTSKEIDLDKLLALDSKKDTTTESGSTDKATTTKKQFSTVEPDLSALKNIDLAGSLDIGKLKASNATTTNINMAVVVKNGIAQLSNFSADLYEGSIKASAKVNANKNPATYSVTKNITGIQIQPLLADVADTKLLEGTTNAQVKLTGVGLSEKRIRSNMKGTIAAQITDGAIYGANIPHLIRQADELISKGLSGEALTMESVEQKTDFASLEIAFNVSKGLATATKLDLTSPAITTTGSGKLNLLTEMIDLTLQTKVAEGLEGSDIKGKTLPVKISGSFQQPSFKLDLEDIAKEVLQEKAEEIVEEKLGNALNKLFN